MDVYNNDKESQVMMSDGDVAADRLIEEIWTPPNPQIEKDGSSIIRVKLYDSNVDRPYVKAWVTFPLSSYSRTEYDIFKYGGRLVHHKWLIPAADDILSNFFLYGGYAGEFYMECLGRLVKDLLTKEEQAKEFAYAYAKRGPLPTYTPLLGHGFTSPSQ